MKVQFKQAYPVDCPICKKLVWYSEGEGPGGKTVFEAKKGRLVVHHCLETKDEFFWNKKIFAMLSKAAAGDERIAAKINWRRAKLGLKIHDFAVITEHFGEPKPGYRALGVDGAPLKLLPAEFEEMPPNSVVRLIDPRKTAGDFFRVVRLEAVEIPFYSSGGLSGEEEIYGLVFKAPDSEQLEIFMERMMNKLKHSVAMTINFLPLPNEDSEEGTLYGFQVNFASERGMPNFFRQLSIPEYVDFSIVRPDLP